MEENITVIKEVFGYNDMKAREVLNILSTKDIDNLKAYLNKGGTGK
jgi:hypothetical protein